MTKPQVDNGRGMPRPYGPEATDLVVGEDAMVEFGKELAARLGNSCLVTLSGDLGTGKTTIARGVLRGLGHQGRVKSPTYTLVEPYECGDKSIYHFDFYRIQDPLELELVGIPELLTLSAIRLVEWPNLAGQFLPEADISIHLEVAGEGRLVNTSTNINTN